MGDQRVGVRAWNGVVIAGKHFTPGVQQPQGAVEVCPVDVEGHRLARNNGDGIIFDAAMGRGDDGRVRDGGRIVDRRVGEEVKGPVQRNRRGDRIVGRGITLDDVRGTTAQGGRAGNELIGPAAAIQRVDAAATAQDIGVAVARQCVGIGRTGHVLDLAEGVDARRTAGRARCQIDRDPGAGPGIVRGVDAGAAGERVIAQGADQDVVAVPAVQDVVAGAAVQRVAAGQAVDGVVTAKTADNVRQGGAGDGFTGDVAADHDAARRRRRDGLVGELQEFDIGDGHVLTVAGDRADLAVPRHGIGRARAREHDRIRAQPAVDDVRAGVRGEAVVARVAAEGVRTAAADGVLDHRAERDGDVADQPADVGETSLTQIDDLAIVRIAREVERIGPAGVPDAENQGGG